MEMSATCNKLRKRECVVCIVASLVFVKACVRLQSVLYIKCNASIQSMWSIEVPNLCEIQL